MRVLVDARKLADGGIGAALRHSVTGIVSIGAVSVSAILRPGAAPPPEWGEGVGIVEDKATGYSWDESVRMPRRLDWRGVDLFHSPHYTLPYGVPVPTVVTIHDLMHVRTPESARRLLAGAPLIFSAALRASAVVCVSRATAADLTRFLGPFGRRVTPCVVPDPLDPVFLGTRPPSAPGLPSTPRPADASREGTRFFSVHSNRKPHKKLGDLLAAFALVRGTPAGRGATLRVAGQGTSAGEAAPPGVRFLGPLAPGDLAAEYAAAAALVVASSAEGFCMPAAEAHAFGTPVVCRPLPALAELACPEDVVAEDFSVAALAAAMRRAAEGPRRLSEAAVGALRARLSPAEVARSLLDVYARALGAPGAGRRAGGMNGLW